MSKRLLIGATRLGYTRQETANNRGFIHKTQLAVGTRKKEIAIKKNEIKVQYTYRHFFLYIIICVYKTKPYSIPTKFSDVHANSHFNHSTRGGGRVYMEFMGVDVIYGIPLMFSLC